MVQNFKMKKKRRNFRKSGTFLKAVTNLIILSIIIIAVSAYFVFNDKPIGPICLLICFANIIYLKIIKVKLRHLYPDFVFGFVDNGILVFALIIGGKFGGIPGAIIGGVAGNTITDSIGGLFEGYVSEKLTKGNFERKRTALSSSLGKMTGCLFGEGIVLTVIWLINLI